MDDIITLVPRDPATAGRPLRGMTILVVEDSRLACENLRLMCQQSGARMRRADCLASARRHLGVYRPSAALIDMGLPDGPGGELIAEMARARPRVNLILGLSGDPGAGEAALAAGADGFLAKPLESLERFRQALLPALPEGQAQPGVAGAPFGPVAPDLSACRDDMRHVAALLDRRRDGATLDYAARFLRGVARAARDPALEDVAGALALCRPGDGSGQAAVARLRRLLQTRLEARISI